MPVSGSETKSVPVVIKRNGSESEYQVTETLRATEDRRIKAIWFSGHSNYDNAVGGTQYATGWIGFTAQDVGGNIGFPGSIVGQEDDHIYMVQWEYQGGGGDEPRSKQHLCEFPGPGIDWSEDDELNFITQHSLGNSYLVWRFVIVYEEV